MPLLPIKDKGHASQIEITCRTHMRRTLENRDRKSSSTDLYMKNTSELRPLGVLIPQLKNQLDMACS
jgi:hypothetical protein